MAVHHAVGISRQRNSGYRPSRVNIVAQGLSTPDPSLSPTHHSIRRGRATTTHYTHHQVSLVVSRNTTLVPSLGLRIGHAKGACVTPNKKERKKERLLCTKFHRNRIIFHDHCSRLLSFEKIAFLSMHFGDRRTNGRTNRWTASIRKAIANGGLIKQEARLSQTDRATLRVTEYFAVTQDHSK